MARPQLENGHTKIANELIDALCRFAPGGAGGKVFLAVIRKTYGWHKKQDTISINQLIDLTQLSRRMVIYAIQNLEAMKMIVVNRSAVNGRRCVNTVSIQKDYDQWLPEERGEKYTQQLARKREAYQNSKAKGSAENCQDAPIVALPSEAEQPIVAPSNDESLHHTIDESLHQGSAENCQLVVQRIVKNAPIVAPTKERKITKETIQKKEYGEFLNVLLKVEEYEKLKEKIGQPHADDLIEQLSGYMRQSPANAKKYIDHYATILNWSRRDGRNGQHQNNPRKLPTAYTRPEDL